MEKMMYSTAQSLPRSNVQMNYSQINYNSPISKAYLGSPVVSNQNQMHSINNYASFVPKVAVAVETVYCPVCHMDYPENGIEQHVEIHSRYTPYTVIAAGQADSTPTRKDLSATEASERSDLSVSYPMVQPLEFWTKELAQVQKNTFKVVVNEKGKLKGGVVQLQSTEVQTLTKPPLQSPVRESDLYNCFDNAFNSHTKFSADDITTNNVGLASKRGFTEWEQMRLRK